MNAPFVRPDEGEEDQGEDGSGGIAEHVFLRIPDVALRSEDFETVFTSIKDGINPFENFVSGGDSHDGAEGEDQCYRQGELAGTSKPFGNGEGV